MHDGLNARGPRHAPDLGDGGGEVVLRDLIAVRTFARRRQGDARAEVEEPNVVSMRVEVLDQVRLDCIDGKYLRRHAEAVRQEDGALRAAHMACEPQVDAVFGAEWIKRGGPGTQGPTLARR